MASRMALSRSLSSSLPSASSSAARASGRERITSRQLPPASRLVGPKPAIMPIMMEWTSPSVSRPRSSIATSLASGVLPDVLPSRTASIDRSMVLTIRSAATTAVSRVTAPPNGSEKNSALRAIDQSANSASSSIIMPKYSRQIRTGTIFRRSRTASKPGAARVMISREFRAAIGLTAASTSSGGNALSTDDFIRL